MKKWGIGGVLFNQVHSLSELNFAITIAFCHHNKFRNVFSPRPRGSRDLIINHTLHIAIATSE